MTAQIISLKTKNQIYKDFKTFIETALKAFNITGWEVKRLEQVIKTEDLKPCVFIQVLNKKQTGAQYRENIRDILEETPDYNKQYFVKNEITIRFSASRRELLTDTAQTFNGFDVLELIKNYFQSADTGVSMFKNAGYAQYKPSEIQPQSFNNDDENIQFLPFFDCVYVYTDSWKNGINKIDEVEEKYKKGV